MCRNRIAVSYVISTIILLAVVITVSVAIAYWMGAISSQYNKVEKLEIVNAIVSPMSYGDITTWTITISLKNTGTTSATITDIYLNDRPLTNSGSTNPPNPTIGNGGWYASSPIILSGSSATFIIVITNGGPAQPFTSLSPGVSMNFKLHSSGGMDYTKLIELI
jgi:archaeal type IV pilus assembly protein PilA